MLFPRQVVIDLPSWQINDISQKGKRKKLSYVLARPVDPLLPVKASPVTSIETARMPVGVKSSSVVPSKVSLLTVIVKPS